ncbi:MAG: hypothetical protein JXX28_12625 [Deltaproteobacteria bacterium]|nr:hypothetical protein [Deltaproteobacteria bacterium]
MRLFLDITRRLVALSGAVSLMGAGAWGLSISAGVRSAPELAVLRALVASFTPLGWAAVSGGAVVVGFTLGALAVSVAREERGWHLLSRSEAGSIAVSDATLRALLGRVGGSVDGVSAVRARVRMGREGWDLRCHAECWTDAQLHQTGGALKEALSAALELHTGLPVHRADVTLTYVRKSAAERVH